MRARDRLARRARNLRYTLDQQDRRPTLPPPAPTPKDTLEAVVLVHTSLDVLRADVATLKGGQAGLHSKLDQALGTLERIATQLLRDHEFEKRLGRIERQLAAAE